MGKRGRPKGSKNKTKVEKKKKKISLICGLCLFYYQVAINNRIEEKESTYRKTYSRLCNIVKKEVSFDTEACERFSLAEIIGCGSDNLKSQFRRMYTKACINRLVNKDEDCRKCLIKEILLKYTKEKTND